MGIISFISEIYENIRKDTPNVKKVKPERHYEHDGGFTGSKKEDFIEKIDIKPVKKCDINHSKEESDKEI